MGMDLQLHFGHSNLFKSSHDAQLELAFVELAFGLFILVVLEQIKVGLDEFLHLKVSYFRVTIFHLSGKLNHRVLFSRVLFFFILLSGSFGIMFLKYIFKHLFLQFLKHFVMVHEL